MSQHFDTIILGCGNAGFGVSSVLAGTGQQIAMVEAAEFGGVCPNRGCTPKKVLVAAATAMHEIERASIHTIDVSPPKLDWAKLIERKTGMIDFIPDAMRGVAEKRGQVFTGRARFVRAQEVDVNVERLTGDNIVIAIGSTP